MSNSIQYPMMKADRWCFVFDIAMSVGCAVTVVTVFVSYVFRLAWSWLPMLEFAGACLALASGIGMVIALLVRRYQRRAFIAHEGTFSGEPYPQLAEQELTVNIMYNDGEGRLMTDEEREIFEQRWMDDMQRLCNEYLMEDEIYVGKIQELIHAAASRPKARNSTKGGVNGMAVSCMLLALMAEEKIEKKWLADKKRTMEWLALINGFCIYEDNHFLDYFNAAMPYPKNQQRLINDYRQQVRETFA